MHFCKYLLYCSFVILIKSLTISCKKTTPEVIYELTRTLQDQKVIDTNENVVISPLGATLALAQLNQITCCRFKNLLKSFMKWENIGRLIFIVLIY